MAKDWVSFWNAKHSIYVNDRHRAAHYARIAADLARFVPRGGAVLDYGCGEALSAPRVAENAGRLTLCEAATNVRTGLAARFAREAKIEVVSPAELATRPDGSFDLVVMHSVAQYLTPDELDRMLALFRRLLKPGGLLVLGDVIPPDLSALTDATALLRFGAEKGFLGAALFGLVRTAFSDYRTLRNALGLARHDEPAMLDRLRAAGFLPKRAALNVGHNPARMTFLAWPAGSPLHD